MKKVLRGDPERAGSLEPDHELESAGASGGRYVKRNRLLLKETSSRWGRRSLKAAAEKTTQLVSRWRKRGFRDI